MRPSSLEHDDCVTIDVEPFSDRVFRVSDIEVSDIGLTEVVVVTLVSDDMGLSLTGTTADSIFTIEDRNTGDEYSVFDQQIETLK